MSARTQIGHQPADVAGRLRHTIDITLARFLEIAGSGDPMRAWPSLPAKPTLGACKLLSEEVLAVTLIDPRAALQPGLAVTAFAAMGRRTGLS